MRILPPLMILVQTVILTRLLIAPRAARLYFWGNIFIILPLVGMLILFPLGFRKTSAIISAILYLTCVFNKYVQASRGRPISFIDIYCVKDAWAVSSRYPFTFTLEMAKLLLLTVLVTALVFYAVGKIKKEVLKYTPIRILIALILIVPLFPTLRFYSERKYGPDWNEIGYVNEHGLFLAVLIQGLNSSVEVPEGYSAEAAEQIAQKYAAETTPPGGDMPVNIIMVMNESLTDYSLVTETGLSEDPLPCIHSLSDNCAKGRVAVNVFGGQTCDSEFEALTGYALAFLPRGSVPYEQYNMIGMDNFPKQLEEMGYSTTPIHGYLASEYKRGYIYPDWFSESFISGEYFSGEYHFDKGGNNNIFDIGDNYFDAHRFGDDLEYVNRFISDAEGYRLVMNLLKKKNGAGEKAFIFNLTIQNHGAYKQYTGDYDVIYNTGDDETDRFLSLSHVSDKAFADFLEDLREYPEPTVVIMFGDHQPKIEAPFMKDYSVGNEYETIAGKYTVPYIMWANYDKEWDVPGYFSLNYLSSIIKRNCNLKMEPLDELRLQAMEEVPVITLNYVRNANGEFVDPGTAASSEAVREYRIMQYRNMFDR